MRTKHLQAPNYTADIEPDKPLYYAPYNTQVYLSSDVLLMSGLARALNSRADEKKKSRGWFW
jgi:hypothetical protein